jgi:hypothetical protein
VTDEVHEHLAGVGKIISFDFEWLRHEIVSSDLQRGARRRRQELGVDIGGGD